MKILQVYMLDMFLPIFFLVLVCASMILDAIDILVNLTQFISNGYRFSSLVKIWYVSIPHYVLLCCPLSVLFAATYTVRILYVQNEFLAIHFGGLSFFSIVGPWFGFMCFLAIGIFAFDNSVVVVSQSKKDEIIARTVSYAQGNSENDVVASSFDGKIISIAGAYHRGQKVLVDMLVIMKNSNGTIQKLIEAHTAHWQKDRWVLIKPVVYTITHEMKLMVSEYLDSFELREPLELFDHQDFLTKGMSIQKIKETLHTLKYASKPHRELSIRFYKKFYFPLTMCIMLCLSFLTGSFLKKRSLIMYIFCSVVLASAYYVVEMTSIVCAREEYFSPFWGVFFPVLTFLFLIDRKSVV